MIIQIEVDTVVSFFEQAKTILLLQQVVLVIYWFHYTFEISRMGRLFF